MKCYRHPWIITAVTLSLSSLVLLAPAMEIPALGQPGSHIASHVKTARGSNAKPLAKTATGSNAKPLAKTATDSNAEPLEVVKIKLTATDSVVEAERGRGEEILSQLFNAEPLYEKAIVKLSDGSKKIYPIRYDFDSLDESRTGLTAITGYITPEDGCSISAELAEVALPVFLYDPNAPCEMPAVSMEPLFRTQIVLSEHAVLQELEDMAENGILDSDFYYSLEGGLTWSKAVSWDFSKVEFGIPGIYKAAARPILPDGILLPDGLSEQVCDIVIQEDGPLLLAPPEFNGLYMSAEWTKETPDPGRFRCFYAIGDGDWQEDVEQDLISIPRFAPYYLMVFYYEDVFFEIPYYFQISYDGEYSNILKVYFTEGQIHYRLYDGDRDGGDREDQTPPNISQTIPPPGEPSESLPGEPSEPAPGEPSESLPGEPSEPAPTPETTLPSGNGTEETPPDGSTDIETTQPNPPSSNHSSGDRQGGSNEYGDPPSHRAPSGDNNAASGPGYGLPAAPSRPDESLKEVPAAAPTALTAVSTTENGTEDSLSEQGSAPRNPDTAAAVEEDTADYVVLSGMRLKKYMELHPGQPLLITKHRIQLEIPMENGIFSVLEDQSLFRAELASLSDHTIQVQLFLDGVPIPLEDIPELTITMPRPDSEEGASLQVAGPDGTVLAAVQAVDDSRITFTLNQTGTFRIQTLLSDIPASDIQGSPSQEQPGPPSSVPAVQTALKVLAVLAILTILAVPAVLLIPSSPFCLHRFRRRTGKTGKKGGGEP